MFGFIIKFKITYCQQPRASDWRKVEPGIVFIFEGAIKDHVMQVSHALSENETHVHIEARVNWDTKDTPKGTVSGGFAPYMYINEKVTNENTGLSTFIDLVPHIQSY